MRVLTVAGEPEQRQDVTARPAREVTVRFTVRRAATGSHPWESAR